MKVFAYELSNKGVKREKRRHKLSWFIKMGLSSPH